MNNREPTEPPGDLLTTEQVMEILIADANLRRHAATCVLPAVSVDGRTYFRRSDLDAWHERQFPKAMPSSWD
jgi:hypothetical protein